MGLYETLKRAIGLRAKGDFDQVQRILKESGDAVALEYDRNPELRSRLEQERQRYIEAYLTLRDGVYWFRNAYYERGPYCTV